MAKPGNRTRYVLWARWWGEPFEPYAEAHSEQGCRAWKLRYLRERRAMGLMPPPSWLVLRADETPYEGELTR